MDERIIEQQIDALNQKLDTVIDLLVSQHQKNEVVEDLIDDLSIVGKNAFQATVDELAVQNISIEADDLKYLFFKVLGNIKTFGELMDMLESVVDLVKDLGPIVHDASIAVTEKLGQLDREGYFSYLNQLGLLAIEFKKNFTEKDITRLREEMPAVGAIVRNLSQPQVVNALATITETLSEMKLDDKLDNKSLFRLFRELNKPDVRKTLSFTLRLLAELGKKQDV
ncbi:MAG: hypothetical protein GX439_02650 [Bacteroidales bacterium]|nr:hypothetical protein [Bacteroidales bacterium]HRC93654.1 hypothetical protein [Tenuifilaceae bacterium]